MKLTFLGTRGEIEARSRWHRRHAALLISYQRRRVVVDCGADWLREIAHIKPHAIVVTHAHPDHAFGLANGAPCPVYATQPTWDALPGYPIAERHKVLERLPFSVAGIRFEAFDVEHSIRAPAVGYRITAGKVCVFYVPDLVFIRERAEALHGGRLYIGDGASLQRPLVRRRGDQLIGHTPISTQLTWCRIEGVPRAVFTHCGSQIVNASHREIAASIRTLGEARGIAAEVAYDGLELRLR